MAGGMRALDGADTSALLCSPPDVMTPNELAAFLRCDRKTVYALVQRRKIPFRHLGRAIRFSRSAVLEWLGQNPSRA